MSEHKIVITGTMGAGKTTAIAHISEIPPIDTDVRNTRPSENAKPTTTAAFDYGELSIGDGDVLRLYGTPGQARFSFMWPVIARNALGIIYLIDASRPEPLADLNQFLDGFGAKRHRIPSVVAINKLAPGDVDEVAMYQEYLEQLGLPWPAVWTDVRQRDHVLDVFEILLSLNEARALEEQA